MESFSREFALFIDGIRLERDISRVDLIDGIISLSQYKRYLRGVASIPNNVVIELADRLKYNITDLYSLYTRKYSKEDNQLREIYSLIQSYKYEEAYLELSKINDELLVSSFYKSFYDYLSIHTQHKLGRVSDIHVLSLYSSLINYPSCMKNESFNMIEMNVLNQIVTISSNMENYEPANLLYKILTSKNFSYAKASDTSILPPIIYTVARVTYKQNDYLRTIEVTNLGIATALKHENSNALSHLFYLNASANKQIGNIEESLSSVKKCFLQLIVCGNVNIYKTFLSLYEQNYDIPLSELLKDMSDLIEK